MGVKTLNRLIHRYGVHLLRDIELRDTSVVIDGSELFYNLYFDYKNAAGKSTHSLDHERRGGEYSEFRKVINDFFNTLTNLCNIRCYVVFDRFKSENNVTRYLETRTEKLRYVIDVVEGRVTERGARSQPILGKDVLTQTLQELSIPYVVVPGDGDAELAAIANEMDAYVLACDTDFCIFDLSKGFLPLEDLRWQGANESCRCKIFRRQILEQTFNLPPNSVTFLEAVLSSQDGLQEVDFLPFLKALSKDIRIPRHLLRGYRRRPDDLENLLIWLGSNYRNDDSAIAYIQQRVQNLPTNKFRRCLEIYRQPPDVSEFVEDLRQGGHRFAVHKACFHLVGDPPVRTDFLPLVPDDQDRPSCHKMSSSIRRAIYQIGIMQEGGGVPDESFPVLVTDRHGRRYAAEFVNVTIENSEMAPLHLELEDEMLVQRDDMHDIMESREHFILDVLLRGENAGSVECFSNETKLPAAIFKFWSSSNEDDERQVDEAIKALAFTLSTTYHQSDLPHAIQIIPEAVFDKGALHSSSQWLSCMKAATILNSVLNHPLEGIVMARLFSGLMYQRAHSYFTDSEEIDDDRQAEILFPNDTDAQTFYRNLLNI